MSVLLLLTKNTDSKQTIKRHDVLRAENTLRCDNSVHRLFYYPGKFTTKSPKFLIKSSRSKLQTVFWCWLMMTEDSG